MIHRSLSYEVRALATLALNYFLSMMIILQVDILSGGPIWLFGFAVIAGLLLGLKAAIIALLINTATVVSLLQLYVHGMLETPLLHVISIEQAIAAAANYILFNAIISVSCAILIQVLQSTVRKKVAASAALQEEKSKLRET